MRSRWNVARRCSARSHGRVLTLRPRRRALIRRRVLGAGRLFAAGRLKSGEERAFISARVNYEGAPLYPKIELHVHLEATMRIRQALALTRRACFSLAPSAAPSTQESPGRQPIVPSGEGNRGRQRPARPVRLRRSSPRPCSRNAATCAGTAEAELEQQAATRQSRVTACVLSPAYRDAGQGGFLRVLHWPRRLSPTSSVPIEENWTSDRSGRGTVCPWARNLKRGRR